AALHGKDAGHFHHRSAAALDEFLPLAAGAARDRGGTALFQSDAGIRGRRAIHAREMQQVAAVIEDGDRHVPFVLARLGFGRGHHLHTVVLRQYRSCFHLIPRQSLICCKAFGSLMVVRSPGSRPSASAAIERRSVLPERVLGSSVTKCTAFGRPIAPSCLSTVSMTSCDVVFFDGSFRTAKASGIWPFSWSTTPTTAHSAILGCMLTASSISRVPRRWPATLIT